MESVSKASNGKQPYAPSWYDRFVDWLERLPGPTWVYYSGAGVVSVGLFVGIQAWQGAYDASGFYPWHIFLALQPLIVLGWLHYIDHVAIKALDRFKPALSTGDQTLHDARFRMTTLPAKPALAATALGLICYFLLFGPQTGIGSIPDLRLVQSTATIASVFGILGLMWALMGVAIYHTIHKIMIIRELFAQHTQVDIFNQEPVYAFSNITGRTAAILILNSYGWVLGLIQSGVLERNPGSAVGTNVFFAAFSLFIFAWPLWGAHQLLVDAKKDALATNAALMKKALDVLHNKVKTETVENIGDWQDALAALELERTRVERAPTWPWRPEALRGLIAALIVPIVVWFAQYLLERILG